MEEGKNSIGSGSGYGGKACRFIPVCFGPSAVIPFGGIPPDADDIVWKPDHNN